MRRSKRADRYRTLLVPVLFVPLPGFQFQSQLLVVLLLGVVSAYYMAVQYLVWRCLLPFYLEYTNLFSQRDVLPISK